MLQSRRVCFEAPLTIPKVTLTYQSPSSREDLALVKRLQTLFEVTKSRYKMSVLKNLWSTLQHFEFISYHFPFTSFRFVSFLFFFPSGRSDRSTFDTRERAMGNESFYGDDLMYVCILQKGKHLKWIVRFTGFCAHERTLLLTSFEPFSESSL